MSASAAVGVAAVGVGAVGAGVPRDPEVSSDPDLVDASRRSSERGAGSSPTLLRAADTDGTGRVPRDGEGNARKSWYWGGNVG